MRSTEMTVTVDKTELLGILRTNREQHVTAYAEAEAAYRALIVKEMRKRANGIDKGGEINTSFFQFKEPEEFTDDFDSAIKMLEWHQGNTLDLSREQFDKYVLNNWEWTNRWQTVVGSYTTSA